MMYDIKKQSGFTLVEIAIVLVIIGLLLGGILKGQELINSARVRNMADQNSGIQAAYFGFIDRYRQLHKQSVMLPFFLVAMAMDVSIIRSQRQQEYFRSYPNPIFWAVVLRPLWQLLVVRRCTYQR